MPATTTSPMTTAAAPARALWLAPLFLSLSALSWAGNHVVARSIAGEVPPGTVNLLRWVVVAVLVGVVAQGSIRRDWALMRRHWFVLAALGVSGGGIFGTLQYVGLQYTTVINMGVLNSVAPAMLALAGFLAFRDALRPMQVFGITVSLVGVVAIASRLDLDVLRTMEFNRGDVIIFANMALFAGYSAFLRKRPPIALGSFLFALALAAAAANVPWAIYEHVSGSVFAVSAKSLGAVAYAAIFTSIVAYVCWSRGVEAIGPGRAGVFLHLIPVFNFGFGILLLGEPVKAYHGVGLALILLGVWLTTRGR
jgi:drug/metabolite transporter (DMT)-like permease